ncbi:MAG: hypothetical protein KI790_03070 [Cyclobacteriaceae bacterium]|nr:hypothetical protein [Cyclobacteriaceae bacterium HetDA_MAG_MS6]
MRICATALLLLSMASCNQQKIAELEQENAKLRPQLKETLVLAEKQRQEAEHLAAEAITLMEQAKEAEMKLEKLLARCQ